MQKVKGTKERRGLALAKLFSQLTPEVKEAILGYKRRESSQSKKREASNSEIIHIPTSIINMKLSSLHWSYITPTLNIGLTYRSYLEALLGQPIGSQGYRLERKYITDSESYEITS